MNLLTHRKVKQGYSDKFVLTFDRESKHDNGLIFREPMDISGWSFELFFHKNVELQCATALFGLKGDVLDGKTGKVYFKIPASETRCMPVSSPFQRRSQTKFAVLPKGRAQSRRLWGSN